MMTFKKPEEVVGNHIAKYQAMKLAKMLMAYDFDRKLNPFVELGGFLFTFIGDGEPGHRQDDADPDDRRADQRLCEVAGYPFRYENFGVDQISSYQGKSGQNCRRSSTTCSTRGRSASAPSTTSTRWRPSAPTTARRPASKR